MRYHRTCNNFVGKIFKYPGELPNCQRPYHATAAFQGMERTPCINQVIPEIRTVHPGRNQRLQLRQFLIRFFQKDWQDLFINISSNNLHTGNIRRIVSSVSNTCGRLFCRHDSILLTRDGITDRHTIFNNIRHIFANRCLTNRTRVTKRFHCLLGNIKGCTGVAAVFTGLLNMKFDTADSIRKQIKLTFRKCLALFYQFL